MDRLVGKALPSVATQNNEMKIVLLSHPEFLGHQSMPRYTNMLCEGMKRRGHDVEVLAPQAKFTGRIGGNRLRKWMGYIDQYLVFPRVLRSKLRSCPPDTLFVVTDHALGPWVPLVRDKRHVIHCHDFLAQRSAKGEIPENPTGFTGRIYQAYIRNGYSAGRNFISVSRKTREDLHEFLGHKPAISEVVYNGIDIRYNRIDTHQARSRVKSLIGADTSNGYLLHVGGNQWYKNRYGVIKIYEAWRRISNQNLPLVMIGTAADDRLISARKSSPFSSDIYFVSNADDADIVSAYNGAVVFLFPSLAEGFGWPIAEAMACGCPVITTNEAPMTEVGGTAAKYISRMPSDPSLEESWANSSAGAVADILSLTPEQYNIVVKNGLDNVTRFNEERALDNIENIYTQASR